MGNILKKTLTKETPEKAEKKANPRTKNVGKFLNLILGGSYIGKENFYNNIPFIVFIAILVFTYISNSYYSEKLVTRLEKMNKDLEFTRVEFVNIKSVLMDSTKQSNVASMLEPYGIKESKIPPKKIIVKLKSN